MLQINYSRNTEVPMSVRSKGTRSHSAQGLATDVTSPSMKMPLPPRMWITDIEGESSEDGDSLMKEDGLLAVERPKVRSRFRHHKQRTSSIPIGIFWDIENCQVPRGCSAIDVVTAIRAKFLPGKREADFVVVCDVRKESVIRLQELNDAQVSLIHVCGTQKNAADEKLRQCMRRFGELHSSPASLLLISGDINFAADLSDFRHRKNMEVILVHKQNTSSALITCASSHYWFNELTADLPRNPKRSSQSNEEDEMPTCEMEVMNIPWDQPTDRVSRRLRRLADNCGGKVLKVTAPTALLRFPTLDHASRALKRMDGEDVFGRKISTRYARSAHTVQPTYSSDEGYGTATATSLPPHAQQRGVFAPIPQQVCTSSQNLINDVNEGASRDWVLALQQLPAPAPPPLDFCQPTAPKPRKIRGTHGSVNLDRSGCSSSNSCDDSHNRDNSQSRAISPWNSSASLSEHSDVEHNEPTAELTVTNLPLYDPNILQEMLTQLFNQYVPVIRVSVWSSGDGPQATIVLRSESDARLAIARVHKRRLDNQWTGRRLELSLGRPSPAPNLDVLRARLRAILLDQKHYTLPLLRLRDAYASRHCCALTTSDIAKVKDTVTVHENFGRMVQLIDLTPVSSSEMEEAPWKCQIHASLNTGQEDGSRILQPVYMEVATLAENVKILLEKHGGILPLLSFVECYEATFPPLVADLQNGVALELLLRNAPEFEVKEMPSRHLTWHSPASDAPSEHSNHSESSRSSGERERGRTAPALEPMLALFERELIDLLRTTPRCSIPFSKLIPAFHHHFGRQCRVADYGFTKLPDLLVALGNTVVVLGSGSYRVITLSAAAQSRRWTSDLMKVLKAAPGRSVTLNDIPLLYQNTFARPFTPVDYGVCTMIELMHRVAPQSVIFSVDGYVSLPRRTPTPEERARIAQFANQAMELLCYTPNLSMEFPRFVPAYHAHFNRQLRVANYGCVKLVELFELIPETVRVYCEPRGERVVKLTARAARPVIGQRLRAITPISLATLSTEYARQFGALPLPDTLDVSSLEAFVYAAGGCVEDNVALGPGQAPRWATAVLGACAALCADRSVARGSSLEYVNVACRRMGSEPDLRKLAMAGVLEVSERCIRLAPDWRIVCRLAQILAEHSTPLTPLEILHEYSRRYESLILNADNGLDGVFEFLRRYREIFTESAGRWELAAGVSVPKSRDLTNVQPTQHVDYSTYDTPPGQKGSRVFESPNTNVWCSPPASALPAPTELLTHDNKRRTRLAAQFDKS